MGILQQVLRGRYSHNPSATNVVAHYTRRQQPDQGGARNFSFDLLRLPVTEVLGTGVVVNDRTRIHPIGNHPMFYSHQIGYQSVADVAPGQMFSAPLVDPNAPTASGIVAPVPGM